ncbi:hypothetical protein BDF21DRAFT_335635, partial [Thamnidium elegans]
IKNAIKVVHKMKYEHGEYLVQRILSDKIINCIPLVQMLNSNLTKPVKGLGYNIQLPEEKDENDSPINYTAFDYLSYIK